MSRIQRSLHLVSENLVDPKSVPGSEWTGDSQGLEAFYQTPREEHEAADVKGNPATELGVPISD
jgi:hypothetical protein